jgi:hypothetical protein
VKSTNYGTPHCTVFSSILSLHPCYVQIFLLNTLFADTLSLCSSLKRERLGLTATQKQVRYLFSGIIQLFLRGGRARPTPPRAPIATSVLLFGYVTRAPQTFPHSCSDSHTPDTCVFVCYLSHSTAHTLLTIDTTAFTCLTLEHTWQIKLE